MDIRALGLLSPRRLLAASPSSSPPESSARRSWEPAEPTTDEPQWSPHVAMAGAVAGLVSESMLHPFDTVSHRAKVHPQARYGSWIGAYGLIVREEGLRGLIAGVSVTLLVSGPANAAYFWTYTQLKNRFLTSARSEHERQIAYFASGALAELSSSTFFIPTEVVKCRLQLGRNPNRATGGIVDRTTNYRGFYHAMTTIYREEGLAALWAGWQTSMLQDCLFSAFQFLIYENLRNAVRAHNDGAEPSSIASFLIGGTAGGFAAAITNPVDVITARLMSQNRNSRGFGKGVMGAVRVALSEGSMSLWRGTLSRVACIMPAAALQFTVFEALREFLGGRSSPDHPGEWGPEMPPPRSSRP